MLTLVNEPCYIKHFPSWARDPTEQWLHFYRAENSSVPYTRLRSSRISRARQTMEDGGVKDDADNFKEDYLLPPLNSSSCYARRKSCPSQRPADNNTSDYSEYLHPSEIIRPASACGFYKKDDPCLLLSNGSPTSPTSPDLSYLKPKFFTRSSELLGSVRRSVKKYTRNKMADPPASTEPKLPSVMKSFARGVSPEPRGNVIGQKLDLGRDESSASTEIFDV